MKKVTMMAVCIAMLSLGAMAQTVSIRPAFGLNATHLSNEGVEWNSKEQRIGYQFGVGVMVGDKFYVEPGIYWNTISKDLYNVNDPDEQLFENTISAIRVPIDVGYHIIGEEDGIFDLRLIGGVAGTFVTGVKSDVPDLDKTDFNPTLIDLHGGLGIDLWIFFIDWTYVYGLTPVFNEGANDGTLQGFYSNFGVRINFN
jgi:hypothetical protein